MSPLLLALLACAPDDTGDDKTPTTVSDTDTDTDSDTDADTDTDTDTDADADTDTDTDTDAPCVPAGAPDAPLRLLTHEQLDVSIDTLLGVPSTAGQRLPAEVRVHGFAGYANTVAVSQLEADALMRATEDATAGVDWAALLPCDPATGDRTCAEGFVDDFGARAFRRPLEAEERDLFLALYDVMIASDDFPTTMGSLVQAMLQSPQFVYRIELGDPDAVDPATPELVPLTHHELAARLSFLFWNGPPDDALLAAADAGTLHDPTELAAQVDRLLADPKARDAFGHFVTAWMEIDELPSTGKDATRFPDWSPERAEDLLEETRRFSADVVFDGDGSLDTLLVADHSFVNGALADHYDVTGPTDPEDWVRVVFPAGQRSGLLTQGAFLANAAHNNQTSIVHRGLFVFEQLYCGEQQEPPDDLDITLPPLDEDISTRERFARHTQDPVCAGCHTTMDPIGLGFEHYDPVGRWREVEGNDVLVDASGVLTYTSQAGAFYGAPELADLMTGVPEVKQCFVVQWFRSTWGREAGDADTCSIEELEDVFATGDVPALLRAIPHTDAFRHRAAVVP